MAEVGRSGFVSLTGRPSVGKSTLLNRILGQKVSIVTSRAQTTRNRILGIKTLEHAQIIFVDTPGIHRPRHKLGRRLVETAKQAVGDVDLVLFMVEPRAPSGDDREIARMLRSSGKPVMLLINKADTVKKPSLLPVMDEYSRLFPFEEIIPVSALKGDGVDNVIDEVARRLPEGPMLYPEDMVTDMAERFLVAEIVREKAMELTGEEVPHSLAVEITRWNEREDGLVEISANIYVEKKGQRGIIIGKKGERLKRIGTYARADIERLLDSKVFLELWVKVRPDWRADDRALTELGLG